MQTRFPRKTLAAALLALAIAPVALTATAAPDDGAETREQWLEARAEHQAERRAALFERAGIDAATREALESASREHREAMAELRREHRERMNALLSDEQREALKAARLEMHQEYQAERHQRRATSLQRRMTEMVDGWDLSEEEREALGELRREHYAAMAELRDRDFDSREARREAFQALRDEHQAALGELLSEEQLEEMRQTAREAYGKGPKGGKGDGQGRAD